MMTRHRSAFERSLRLSGRALVLALLMCSGGCFAGPEPLPPKEALERAHERISRLVEEERAHYPDAIAIESPEKAQDASKIIVWYPSHPLLAPALTRPEARNVFERAHPEVKLDAHFIGEWHVAIQKLTVALAAGDPPDIAVVDRSWAARLAQAGRIMPLDGFVSAKIMDDIHPRARAACTLQGRVWALPADGFCSVLFYNQDVLPDSPETWEALRNTGQSIQTEYAIGHLPYIEMLWSAGGQVCELNQSGLTAPPAMRTLDFLVELHDTDRANPRMLGNPAWAFSAFLNGDAAMTAGSSEWLARTRTAPFSVGLAPLPGEDGPVSRLGNMVLIVFAKFAQDKREGITAVLDFLTGPAVQGAEAARLGSMPMRQSVAEAVEIPAGVREAHAAALAPPFIGVWNAAEDELLNDLGLAYRWLEDEAQTKSSP